MITFITISFHIFLPSKSCIFYTFGIPILDKHDSCDAIYLSFIKVIQNVFSNRNRRGRQLLMYLVIYNWPILLFDWKLAYCWKLVANIFSSMFIIFVWSWNILAFLSRVLFSFCYPFPLFFCIRFEGFRSEILTNFVMKWGKITRRALFMHCWTLQLNGVKSIKLRYLLCVLLLILYCCTTGGVVNMINVLPGSTKG